jgi:hypothetical protein
MSRKHEKLITIGEFGYDADAHLARIALEAAGIEACVMGDFLAGTPKFGIPKVELKVKASDAEKAKRILVEQDQQGTE